MMKNKVSIIIPIYNTENYLRRCLNSLIKQTYKNIEILLINDGSTDNSELVCKEYMCIDNRIKYFFQENLGVSSARNLGIENSIGDYIIFIDSDDYVKDNYVMILVNKIKEYDLVCCSYSNCKKINKKVIEKDEFLQSLFTTPKYKYNYQGFIWNKIFKKSIINDYNIKFATDIKYNEDRLFVLEYICKMKRDVYYYNDIVYIYEYRNNSAMNKEFDKSMETEFKAFDKMLQLIQSNINYSKIRKWIELEIYFNSIGRYCIYRNNLFLKRIDFKKIYSNKEYNFKCRIQILKSYLKLKYILLKEQINEKHKSWNINNK